MERFIFESTLAMDARFRGHDKLNWIPAKTCPRMY